MKSRERAVSPLLEMIISILILAFAGVVSVSIFLSARYTQIMSFDKTNAMYKVQNAIEMTKADKNTDKSTYFDENWQECDENEAVFALSVTAEEKEIYEISDAFVREVGKTGHDRDHEIAAFITKTINEELYNAPDELLDTLFTRGSIGEFDQVEYEETIIINRMSLLV